MKFEKHLANITYKCYNFKKDKEVIHQIVVVIRSTEDPEEDGILVLLKGEFNIKDIHKIIKHDAFK